MYNLLEALTGVISAANVSTFIHRQRNKRTENKNSFRQCLIQLEVLMNFLPISLIIYIMLEMFVHQSLSDKMITIYFSLIISITYLEIKYKINLMSLLFAR